MTKFCRELFQYEHERKIGWDNWLTMFWFTQMRWRVEKGTSWAGFRHTHKWKINKKRIERRTLRIFYIKQKNLNTQPAPSPWPSTNLRGKQICMSGLDTSRRKFAITPGNKFQDQWTPIRSMQTNRSKINDANMITKTPDKSNWIIINQRNKNNLYRLNCTTINQEYI